MDPSVWVFVQARLNSKRFPRKVLQDLNGKPLLRYLLDNLSVLAQPIMLVTPDEELADLASHEWGHRAMIGPEDDVLARYVQAINETGAEHVVRITADCPLTQPAMIEQFVRIHLEQDADYSSNTIVRSYPDGLDVECVRADVLRWANQHLTKRHPSREHVTSWLHLRPSASWDSAGRSAWKRVNISQRLTVDTPEDLERVRTIDWFDSVEGAQVRPSAVLAEVEPFVEVVSEGSRLTTS